jgi:hypothetical protein
MDLSPVQSINMRVVPGMTSSENELQGSPSLYLVASYRRTIMPGVPIDVVMRGLGLFEACMKTRKTPEEVAPIVRKAIDATIQEVGTEEAAGTTVQFFVYRHR